MAALVTEVNDAEAIAVRVGEDDEVGIDRIAVPINVFSAEREKAVHLFGELAGVGHVQVQVKTRMV